MDSPILICHTKNFRGHKKDFVGIPNVCIVNDNLGGSAISLPVHSYRRTKKIHVVTPHLTVSPKLY